MCSLDLLRAIRVVPAAGLPARARLVHADGGRPGCTLGRDNVSSRSGKQHTHLVPKRGCPTRHCLKVQITEVNGLPSPLTKMSRPRRGPENRACGLPVNQTNFW